MKRPAFYDDWKSLHAFRVIEKVFKFLYNIVEPEKQVFCMSFLSAHRPNFFNFFCYKARKLKIQVGSVGRQLVLEGGLFNNDISLECYFLFAVILHLKHSFFFKEMIGNLEREHANLVNSIS